MNTASLWHDKQYRELASSWNQALSNRFEAVLGSLGDITEMTEQELFERVRTMAERLMCEWYAAESPVSELSNGEYISSITALDDLVRLAATMGVYGEASMPDKVQQAFANFGKKGQDALAQQVLGVSFATAENREESFSDTENSAPTDNCIFDSMCEIHAPQRMAAAFLLLLSVPENHLYLPLFVDKMAYTSNPDELIVEALTNFCVASGQQQIDWLLNWLTKAIEEHQELSGHPVVGIVMRALAVLASDSGNVVNVFPLMMRSFAYMRDKALAASCLADLGDSRAVPVLMSWLNRQVRVDGHDWYEVSRAIRVLGGDLDQDKHPERFH